MVPNLMYLHLRYLRFGLRSLFLIVTLVALLLGWWRDHQNQLARMDELQREMSSLRAPHLLGHFPQRPPLLLKTRPNAFAALDDGSAVVCGNGEHAELWEMITAQKRLALEHPEPVIDLVVSPDNKTLLTITAGVASPARLWDLASGRMLRKYPSPFSAVPQGPNATLLYWSLSLRSFSSPTGFGFTSIAFSPDGRRFATGCEDGSVIVWNTRSGQQMRRMAGQGRRIRSMHFSPDGVKLLTASMDDVVQLWDVESGASLNHFQFQDQRPPGWRDRPRPIALAPDGRTFAFFVFGTRTEMLRDLEIGSTLERVIPGMHIQIRDAETGEDIRRISGTPMPGRDHIAFLPDGNTLFAVSETGLQLWDVSQARLLASQTGFRMSWYQTYDYAVQLPAISSVMLVFHENHEQTLHQDWTHIAIVPYSSFLKVPTGE